MWCEWEGGWRRANGIFGRRVKRNKEKGKMMVDERAPVVGAERGTPAKKVVST